MNQSKKRSSNKITRLFFLVIFSLNIGIIFFGIFFLWFDDNFPTYGSLSYFDMYFSKKHQKEFFGVSLDKDIVFPTKFRIADFLEEYSNFQIDSFENSDIAFTTQTDDFLFKEASYEKSEIIFTQYAVPITKFGSLKRNISRSDSQKIVLFEEGVSKYFSNSVDVIELSCEEIKIRVNESGEIAIVSPECLDSSIYTIAIDGISIFGKITDDYRLLKDEDYIENYFLKYEIIFSYKESLFRNNPGVYEYLKTSFTQKDVSVQQISSIVMTGVTAMGRGVSWKIAKNGPLYPIEEVKEILRDADISHTSNEVSFVPGCVQEPHTLSFCALPESIETLTSAGIDVVEITGNHNNDKGWSYNLDTIELYEEKEITYIGGGKNSEDAYTVKYTNYGDYKIGWFGFNELGPSYAWADDDRPGAAEYWEDKLIEGAVEASLNADIVIMVFQWANENNSYPTEFQKKTARIAIDNGVDLVVGSQGHGTLKMEFYKGVPIYYGLGNFIFDQMFSDKVREGLILRINTIDEEIKNLEMIPYVIEDYSQPNLVYGEKATEIVDNVVVW